LKGSGRGVIHVASRHLPVDAGKKTRNNPHSKLGITKFLDFVHHPVFLKTREHNVLKTGTSD
jgi:hypothetical protein